MNHLSPDEVSQVVDGSIANGIRSRILGHLELCEHCRSEVEFTRKLERVARSAPLASPSRDFTPRVMSRVIPQTKKSLASKALDHLGNILAMTLVLSVVFIALTSQKPSSGNKGPTFISKTLAAYTEYYATARDFLGRESAKRLKAPVQDPSSDLNKIVLMTIVSIVILVAVDRFVVRRVVRSRR